MDTSLFEYDLPEELIAQRPPKKRGTTKLMQLDRCTQQIKHRSYSDIAELVQEGDVFVVNNTKVQHARLFTQNDRNGKRVEVLLLEKKADDVWYALVGRAKHVRPGDTLEIGGGAIKVIEREENSSRFLVQVSDAEVMMEKYGHVPLPPYIDRKDTENDKLRYNTIFALNPGSAAAPTAGLNLTKDLLKKIHDKGVSVQSVDLVVGLGTFAPVNTQTVEDFKIHSEFVTVPQETVDAVNSCKGRVWAVGTTVVRALETAAIGRRTLEKYSGRTSLFIYPGYEFKIVDVLVTNFHMPRTSLLMMVSAFAGICRKENGHNRSDPDNGRKFLLSAYEKAKDCGYTFLSYGDSMVIGDFLACRCED